MFQQQTLCSLDHNHMKNGLVKALKHIPQPPYAHLYSNETRQAAQQTVF